MNPRSGGRQNLSGGSRSLDYSGGIESYTPPPRGSARQMTPEDEISFPSQLATFGSHIREFYEGQADISSSQLQGGSPGRQPGRSPHQRFMMDQIEDRVQPSRSSPKRESLIEWFDRTVESELEKRKDLSQSAAAKAVVNLSGSLTQSPKSKSFRGSGFNAQVAEGSTSGLDIAAQLRSEQDTELKVAVDKLAKATAICAFEGAVEAAERAAASAPPGMEEEAATAAGAKQFEAEVTGVVRQSIPGIKPIEVIGYVGITRPKKARKS